MNWPNLLACSILATGALAALGQDPKTPGQPKAPAEAKPKPKLAQVDAFEYDGSSISAVSVKNMMDAQKWYAKVLGSRVFYELEAQGWCELTTSVPNMLIGLSAHGAAKPSEDSTISFGVKDMAKAQEWLVKNAVKLDGPVVEIPKTVKLLYFRDPDGNRLMFYEAYVGQ